MNKTNLIGIQTKYGLTERFNAPDIVQQGGIWGPTLCSNHTDSMEKTCQERKIQWYKYKEIVNIPLLTYIDDTGAIAKCGEKSKDLNAFLTTQIETKKLKFNEGSEDKRGKCFKMHIGRNTDRCKSLRVHNENMINVEEITYLGNLISSDGRTSKI